MSRQFYQQHYGIPPHAPPSTFQQPKALAADAKPKRKFLLVDANLKRLGAKYRNHGPSEAALKAAHAGYTDIRLLDKEKNRLYLSQGSTGPLTKPTQFTMDKGITTQAKVKSMGWVDLKTGQYHPPPQRRK